MTKAGEFPLSKIDSIASVLLSQSKSVCILLSITPPVANPPKIPRIQYETTVLFRMFSKLKNGINGIDMK